MRDLLTIGGWLLLVVPTGLAQQSMRQLPAPVKDAGVYHFATGTWTRGGGQQSLGPKVLYANTANTGFFGTMGAACDLVWTDEGRIPVIGGYPSGDEYEYAVEAVQIAYCSSVVGEPQRGSLAFYERYTSCTDPASLTPLAAFDFAVPGGVSSTACWTVTFDLENTGLDFCIRGDGNSQFDGEGYLDDFGWTLTLQDQGANGFNGPLLNGDPNNFPYGDGTFYQNPGATQATGLSTADVFWLTDSQGCFESACYWFDGYVHGSPFASFWLVLIGGGCGNLDWTSYCVATNNSTGFPAHLRAYGSSASAGDITLTSQPVPNQPSFFFHGMNQAQIPFGPGFRCTTGGIARGVMVIGSHNAANYVYDDSDSWHSLVPFVGTTRNFQHWYRDPMAGGHFFNLSDALTGVVPP